MAEASSSLSTPALSPLVERIIVKRGDPVVLSTAASLFTWPRQVISGEIHRHYMQRQDAARGLDVAGSPPAVRAWAKGIVKDLDRIIRAERQREEEDG